MCRTSLHSISITATADEESTNTAWQSTNVEKAITSHTLHSFHRHVGSVSVQLPNRTFNFRFIMLNHTFKHHTAVVPNNN